MNEKVQFQYQMTVDYLRRIAEAGLLTKEELELSISLARSRYHVSEK